jgi:hypothetical protein
MYEKSLINIFNDKNKDYLRELTPVPIELTTEAIFLIFMVLLQAGIYMLQRFIKRYAYFLIDRQRRMQRLQVANQELQDKLKSLKSDNVDLDLDSPITKVIQIIRKIQAKPGTDGDIVDSLDYVIRILSSNKLFNVDLGAFKEKIDKDVKNWLDNMFQNDESGGSNTNNQSLRIESTAPKATSVPGIEKVETDDSSPNVTDIVSKPTLASDTLIQQVLSNTESWNFNCFELAQASNGRPLYYLTLHLFSRHEFFSSLRLETAKVERFLTLVEKGYRLNPYHNSIHATDVTQTIHYFLETLGVNDLITIEERLACILAACVHDVDHPGVNNLFLIACMSDLSARYNDQAVLENHHCARAFEWLIGDETCNFLSHLPRSMFQHIRASIVKMILATDMSMHYELSTKFKIKIQGGNGIDTKDGKDRALIMSIAIKCADVSNPTKHAPLSQKWTDLVMEEFYMQGDLEKSLGLPISRFMDRYGTRVSACQMGFIDFVVQPLYELWDQYLNRDGIFPAMENIKNNREFWKKYVQLYGCMAHIFFREFSEFFEF